MKTKEPPCTERYARWCERSTAQIMGSLLLDLYIYTIKNADASASALTSGSAKGLPFSRKTS